MRGLGLLPFAAAACFGLASATLTSFPVIAPQITSDLQLSYSEVGIITSAYVCGYGLMQVPSGLLGLRFGSNRVLFGAVVLMGLSSLIGLLSATFAGWVISRALLGIGGAAVLPVSLHLLTQSLSGNRLVSGIGVFVSGWGAGMTVGLIGAAEVLRTYCWRGVLLAGVALSVLVGLLLWRALGERPLRAPQRVEDVLSYIRLLPRVARNGRLNLLGLMNAAGTSIMIAVPGFLPLYLTRTFGVSAADASASLATIGLAITLGGWGGGQLANRLGWRLTVTIGLGGGTLLTCLIPFLSVFSAVVIDAVVIALFVALFPAPVQSQFPNVVPLEQTALAAGYWNGIGWAGTFVTTLAFGYLVDWTASFTTAWLWSAVVPLFGIAACLAFPGAVRRIEETQAV